MFAQNKEAKLIQFSGFAMTSDSLVGVPYANIFIKTQNRVASANVSGFFSFAAQEGDTLIFTSIGFKPSVYIIPQHLELEKYSVIHLMAKTEYYLSTVTIYPWNDKDGFKQAFRELNLPKDAMEKAEENTNRQLLAALGEKLPPDGMEASEKYLQARAATASYYGQTAPQNFLNPLAWAEFIRAWKRGDFKKKQKYTPTYKE